LFEAVASQFLQYYSLTSAAAGEITNDAKSVVLLRGRELNDAKGRAPDAIVALLGVSRATVYRRMRKLSAFFHASSRGFPGLQRENWQFETHTRTA
jgi:hypothetical protein